MEVQKEIQSETQISDLIIELGDNDFLKRQHARLLLVHRRPESIPDLIDAQCFQIPCYQLLLFILWFCL